MKLIDLLATKMENWPNPVNALVQSQSGEICPFQSGGLTIINTLELADDWDSAVVTRSAWFEAREALMANSWKLPAGTVCEHRTGPNMLWSTATILALGDKKVFYRDCDGHEWSRSYDEIEFRPIRTAEQIAEEERRVAIAEMKQCFDSVSDELVPTTNSYLEVLFGALHEAGFRKQVEP